MTWFFRCFPCFFTQASANMRVPLRQPLRQRGKGWRKLYDRALLHPFTTGQAQSAGLHPVPFTPHFRILGD